MVSVSPGRSRSTWFTCARPDSHARLRLFCFPYAGGGASIYRGWENHLPPGVEMYAVQPPGRGSRFREQAIDRMETLVAEVVNVIEPFLDVPITLFGHSVGGYTSFELTHRLRLQFGVEVKHLFVSG